MVCLSIWAGAIQPTSIAVHLRDPVVLRPGPNEIPMDYGAPGRQITPTANSCEPESSVRLFDSNQRERSANKNVETDRCTEAKIQTSECCDGASWTRCFLLKDAVMARDQAAETDRGDLGDPNDRDYQFNRLLRHLAKNMDSAALAEATKILEHLLQQKTAQAEDDPPPFPSRPRTGGSMDPPEPIAADSALAKRIPGIERIIVEPGPGPAEPPLFSTAIAASPASTKSRRRREDATDWTGSNRH